MRLSWKSFLSVWFILFLFFSGCGERQPPVDELLLQAETLIDSGQIGNAILVLERCQERAPARVDVLEALAFAHAANNDPMLASLTFSRIVELVPERPEYLLYSAESLLEAQDLTGAIEQYGRYLSLRPGDRAVWVTLAAVQEDNGRLGKALEALLAAEQIESRPQQRIAIGNLYLRTENLAQAQVWFARALEGDGSTRDEALLGLLETAVRSKRFADAEALLARLDAEYPGRLERSDLDNVRDQLQEWRRRQEEAREALAALEAQTTVSVQAEEPIVSGEEAPAAEPPAAEEAIPPSSGELAAAEAEPAPEELPAVAAPVNPLDEHLQQARALRKVGAMQEAIRHYKQALIIDDNRADIWAELSEAYLETGSYRWAQATASEAMRRDPNNPKRVLQFLRAAQNTMESGRLLREMEDAYRQFPQQSEIILVLARAYRDQGNLRNARLLFEKFLNLVPQSHPEWSLVAGELSALGT